MIKTILDYFRNRGEFPDRIRRRHETFWKDPNAKTLVAKKMYSSDSLEKWKDAGNWQRKLSNKFNAREFAKLNGCQVPDLYWKGTNIDEVDFHALPKHYVIRPITGHSSKLVFVMDNGVNLFDKKKYSFEDIAKALKQAIQEKPGLEFLFEEFIQNERGEYAIPNDYKFLCFNGEIACVHVITRLSPKKGFSNFYDENWNKLKKMHVAYPVKEDEQPPACYPEMLKLAKKISKEYKIFVRLDFYATPKGPVFGEFTPTPSMGMNFTTYGKKRMLTYWDKYCEGLI